MNRFYSIISRKICYFNCYCDSNNNDKKNELNSLNQYHWDFNWDGRELEKSSAIRQIILIRHGQYVQKKNDENRILTELGRKQALLTGKRLQELIDEKIIYPIRSIHYSTMTRAIETYQCILPSLTNISQLKPYQHIACSMIREGAVCKPNPPSVSWKVNEEDFLKDNLRIEAAFKNYIQRSIDEEDEILIDDDNNLDSYVENLNHSKIFICHGNVIRYFVMRALQLPPEAWLRTAVYNSSITILNIYPNGRVSMYCMGDVGHLPANIITYN